jgi:O-antigen/teichoic acid export membrane protein
VKRYELITLATQTFQTAALVATLTITRNIAAGLLSIVVAMVVVYTVVAVIYLPQRLRLPEVGNVRRYLSYCSPMVFKEFSHKMLSESDRFIVLFLLGPTAVGIYSVAYGVAALFPNLTNMFNSTLYPTITSAWDEGDTADIRRFYYNFLIGYVLLTIPVLFGLTLLARPVLRVLATETVAVEGWLLVPVVTVAFIFRGFETVLTYVLNAAEETGKVAKGTMIAFLTNLGLNLALIPVVGLMGAAIAMAVSMAVRLGYIYYYVRQHIEIPIPTRRIVKSAFSSIVMAVVLVYLVTTPDSAVIRLIVYPLVGAAVYFAVVYSVGGLTRGDIRQLRALL